MKLRIASAMVAVAAGTLPLGAAESPPTWPDKDLAKFVFEHLDLTSFGNSTGPRRRAGQVFLTDLGVHPDKASDTEAAATQGDWLYSVRILRKHDYDGDGTPEVLICFFDMAQNGGSYFKIDSYVLRLISGRAIALAYDDESFAEKSGCKRARTRADAA
jgi:hypothetical protein